MTLADLNGDGRLELVTGSAITRTNTIPVPMKLWNLLVRGANRRICARHILTMVRVPEVVADPVVDIDGDGHLDIVGQEIRSLFSNLT